MLIQLPLSFFFSRLLPVRKCARLLLRRSPTDCTARSPLLYRQYCILLTLRNRAEKLEQISHVSYRLRCGGPQKRYTQQPVDWLSPRRPLPVVSSRMCTVFLSRLIDKSQKSASVPRRPTSRENESQETSEWREVISHRRRPSLFFWKTGKQIIHHREYTGGCDGTTRSRSPCLLLMMSKDTRAWISGQRRRRRGE